jgi:hypothetical protein
MSIGGPSNLGTLLVQRLDAALGTTLGQQASTINGAGLGQAECGEPAAGGEVGEPRALLLLAAEVEDRQRPERVVRGERDRH